MALLRLRSKSTNVWAGQSLWRSSSRVTTSPGCSSKRERIWKGCSCNLIRIPRLRNSAARRSTSKTPKRRLCGQLSVPCIPEHPSGGRSLACPLHAFNTVYDGYQHYRKIDNARDNRGLTCSRRFLLFLKELLG